MNLAELERERLRVEYRRRQCELAPDLYAPWQPAEILLRSERKRLAATLLHRVGAFPTTQSRCLEIGYGNLGWLGDLVTWGVPEMNLHGIELEKSRARHAQQILPSADLRIGDASNLSWGDEYFHLVIASTVFTSILETGMRQMIAGEIARVLAPGGALLWYDFAVNNPRNAHVRKVNRHQLNQLFPTLNGTIKSLTLAPPLARWIAGKSWLLASLASTIPLFRTHLLAVLVKDDQESSAA